MQDPFAPFGGDRRAAQRWLLNTPDEQLSPELLSEKRRLLREAESRRPMRPRRRLWLSIAIAVLIACLCAFASLTAFRPRTPVPATQSRQWTFTNAFSGNGTSNTATFSVGSDWRLDWSCSPASFVTGQYNVIIDIDSPGQSLPVFPGAINAICSANVYGGTTEEYQSGTFYLAVDSEAAWKVQVEQLI